MLLRYYINEHGKRVYTIESHAPDGTPTYSAHPARFSPDDKYSDQRVKAKRRCGILKTQEPAPSV